MVPVLAQGHIRKGAGMSDWANYAPRTLNLHSFHVSRLFTVSVQVQSRLAVLCAMYLPPLHFLSKAPTQDKGLAYCESSPVITPPHVINCWMASPNVSSKVLCN